MLIRGAVAIRSEKYRARGFELCSAKARRVHACITQPVFDLDTARRFSVGQMSFAIKTMLGILPVKREAMANYYRPGYKT